MAAKVVMVAVPTVLGIASIRVYTVKDIPADQLVTREKLNIYTRLPQSARTQFVPESPGVVESGLTAARESLLPFIQAVKGACVSVKRGTVSLYRAGEDAYYYLKDPPPGFLPRFGTVTMAGLLGMFLARKGSRFKRLVIPLGLMSAGASVCYPAQTVAVLKVTGKKAYAAGQWSSAAVSSLLTSKETVASQSAAETNPESTVAEGPSDPNSSADPLMQSATISDPEVTSAACVPDWDETAVGVTAEEESSVTLTETPTAQDHTQTTAGSASAFTDDPAYTSSAAETREAVSAESSPSSEDTPPPKASGDSAAPFAESAGDRGPVAAVEQTLTPPPPVHQPTTENSKEGSGFKADPVLMDFGQSSPEDEDLYSTRS
ncbi:MICOS complex subunit MIC27 [Pholidichthys leucotaenia]